MHWKKLLWNGEDKEKITEQQKDTVFYNIFPIT